MTPDGIALDVAGEEIRVGDVVQLVPFVVESIGVSAEGVMLTVYGIECDVDPRLVRKVKP